MIKTSLLAFARQLKHDFKGINTYTNTYFSNKKKYFREYS